MRDLYQVLVLPTHSIHIYTRFMCLTSVHVAEIGQCFMLVSIQLVEMACVTISPHPSEHFQLAV